MYGIGSVMIDGDRNRQASLDRCDLWVEIYKNNGWMGDELVVHVAALVAMGQDVAVVDGDVEGCGVDIGDDGYDYHYWGWGCGIEST